MVSPTPVGDTTKYMKHRILDLIEELRTLIGNSAPFGMEYELKVTKEEAVVIFKVKEDK